MGSGIMVRKDGKLWKEHSNKGLDRPRKERGENVLTSCVSKGMPSGSQGDDKRMLFQTKFPHELYGKQTRDVRPKETKDK